MMEGSKIHLVNISPNYGAAEQLDFQQLGEDPFGENYQEDTEFWEKVANSYRRLDEQINRTDIEMRFRLERIKAKYEPDGKDTLIELLTTVYDDFDEKLDTERKKGNVEDAEILDSFVKQLSLFAIILLREDYKGHTDFSLSGEEEESWNEQKTQSNKRSNHDRKYFDYIAVDVRKGKYVFKGKTTILHLAAQRNLTDIAKYYVEKYPGSQVVPDKPERVKSDSGTEKSAPRLPAQNPIEWAYLKGHDDVCSTLMKLTLNERVRDMFEGTATREADYSFHDLIREQKMKKTINAVLDSCVNPNFPYIVRDPEQNLHEKEAWSKMGNTLPLRYQFYFQILDGDDEGKPAITEDRREVREFRSYAPSAFQLIADYAESSNHNSEQDPIKHMVVRQLIRYKWGKYGERLLIMQGVLYLFFLLMLSLALGLAAKEDQPTKYESSLDRFRGFCEIMSILFSVWYLGLEFEQFVRAPRSYTGDKYNILDFFGILSILVLIPCRYAESLTVTRSVSVFAFFINFLRVFKFFPINKQMGIYAKTFNKIIIHDILKFGMILAVVLLAFAGSVYLALAASKAFNNDFSNFWHVFLQEMRAIAEGKEFSDSYSSYHWAFTVFIILNMFTIIVVLSNILIGQISYQYSAAQTEASIQNDIDRAKLITGLDRSIFTCRNRKAYYRNGIFVSDQNMIKDLIEDWKALEPSNTQETVKEMLEKKVLKKL